MLSPKVAIHTLIALTLATFTNADTALSWQRDDSSVALMNHGQTVWKFNARPGDNKPYFHPLSTIDGSVLTQEKPAGHVWHYGLWFSFKYLNGVNFWEENPKTGLSKGRTQVVQIDTQTKHDHSARFDLEIDYLIPEKGEQAEEKLIKEQRVITVSSPDAAGNYYIDFQHHFRALADVTLDRTPLPGQLNGKTYGGYAGLSIRHRGGPDDRQLRENWQFIAPNPVKELHGSAQPWMAYTGKLGEGSGGTAMFDHPSNFNYPSKWYAATPIVYYSPAFIFDSKRTLKKGETLDLRYRVKIYSEAPQKEALKKEWQRFSNKDFPKQ